MRAGALTRATALRRRPLLCAQMWARQALLSRQLARAALRPSLLLLLLLLAQSRRGLQEAAL